ncbi:unnamed protein product, partial [Prorocentrum cordatum]
LEPTSRLSASRCAPAVPGGARWATGRPAWGSSWGTPGRPGRPWRRCRQSRARRWPRWRSRVCGAESTTPPSGWAGAIQRRGWPTGTPGASPSGRRPRGRASSAPESGWWSWRKSAGGASGPPRGERTADCRRLLRGDRRPAPGPPRLPEDELRCGRRGAAGRVAAAPAGPQRGHGVHDADLPGGAGAACAHRAGRGRADGRRAGRGVLAVAVRNPVGREQLRGLTEAQVEKWREPTETRVGTLRVHEDSAGELGLFWATKIGGPSHGFDFEGQCLLPLLCNARHKVVLVTAEEFPHNPCGRAHFRLLWVAGSEPPRAVLWLEGVHMDGAVWEHGAHVPRLDGPVLEHAVAKAVAMGVGLSVSSHLRQELARVAGGRGEVRQVNDAVVLRPSNGVVEASDYLDSRHDWVQMKEEVTGRHSRALFEPRAER